MTQTNVSEEKVILTQEGLEKLKQELEVLVNEKRPNVVEKIRVARDAGDLSENAAYTAAREEQSFIEGRIAELEDIIKRAHVPAGASKSDHVIVGSKVMVHMEGEDTEFILVGAPEANPVERKISHESPLGKALLGKKVGDKAEFDAPAGRVVYTIKSIS